MGSKTGISWTESTWNPVTGCDKVSPGCKNCYAETHAHRFWGARKFTDVQCHPERLDQPLRWRKPQRVFVNSMSDLFHEDVPDEFIDRVFAVMAIAQRHTFQVLTKRPARMLQYLSSHDIGLKWGAAHEHFADGAWPTVEQMVAWTREGLPNVHLGVSVENQETADERIPLLLQTPAAVRFLSVEPMLEPVIIDMARAYKAAHRDRIVDADTYLGIDWVIVGGESGPHARPCNIEWVRSIVAQCKTAGVSCFVKQLGGHVHCQRNDRLTCLAKRPGCIGTDWRKSTIKAQKGDDPAEWPEDLRAQEYPA